MSIIPIVPLRTIETSMLLKVLTGILIILLVGESVYIVLDRHTINRFKPVDQDGYVAFDTATGQLCRSYRSKALEKTFKPAPTSSLLPQSQSRPEDPILAAIEREPQRPSRRES
jgi:hypothetical protein